MFREVARKKQALTRDECIALLKSEKRGVLSVIGDDGCPYGLPINHYYNEEDGRLYFHSGKAGHKIDALRKCSKASFCIIDGGSQKEGSWALDFRSVIVFGTVEFIDDYETAVEMSRRLSYKFTDDSEYIEDEITRFGAGVLVFALEPEHITGKRVKES